VRKFYAFITVIVVLSLLVTACGSRRPGPVVLQLGPRITDVDVPDPTVNFGNETFTFSVTTSGPAVVAWQWSFGGGANPNTSTAEMPTVTLLNTSYTDNASYTGTVTVTDADGRSDEMDFDYDVGPLQNSAPVFTDGPTFTASTTANTATVDFTITDAEADDVTITLALTAPAGVSISDAEIAATSADYGPFTVTVTNNNFEQASVTVDITLDDGALQTSGSVGGDILGMTPATSNAILAVPSATNVAAGDTFTVTVYVFDLTYAAAYFNSIFLTYGDGLSPVGGSWNLGAVGGGTWDKDGAYWEAFPDAILPVGDALFLTVEEGAVVSNCSAQGAGPTGSAVGAGGALFNFQMTADTAGSWDLAFQTADTYYTEPDGSTQHSFDTEEGATITVS
jgi:hypothetical protein